MYVSFCTFFGFIFDFINYYRIFVVRVNSIYICVGVPSVKTNKNHPHECFRNTSFLFCPRGKYG